MLFSWLIVYSFITLLVGGATLSGDIFWHSNCVDGQVCTDFSCQIQEEGSSETLTLSQSDSSFSFSTNFSPSDSYSVIVTSSSYSTSTSVIPLVCTVNYGFGDFTDSDISTVKVTCSTIGYAIGGTIMNHDTSPKLLLNGLYETSAYTPSSQFFAGVFLFENTLAWKSDYEVTVSQQPVGELCVVNYASGVVEGQTTNIIVDCAQDAPETDICYTMSGTFIVDVLSANDGTLSENCPFASCTYNMQVYNGGTAIGDPLTQTGEYSLELCTGSEYDLSASGSLIGTFPIDLTCLVQPMKLSLSSDIEDVDILCAADGFYVGGRVAGAAGDVTLHASWGETLTLSLGTTAFQFSTKLPATTSYTIVLASQAEGDDCQLINANGSGYQSDIEDFEVICDGSETASPSFGPTKTPTLDPTSAPSDNPTEEPSFSPTDIPTPGPTLQPTSDPTPKPISSPPTQTPVTTLPPSKSPSSLIPPPSASPTADCSNFFFGYCPCESDDPVDIIFILDSSNSIDPDEYFNFKSIIAAGIQTTFPQQGSRLGVVQFSNGVQTIVDFDDGGNPAEWASKVRAMEHMQAATYTKRAFQHVWNTMWEPKMASGRRMITIVVTDGEPSPNQDPCEMAQTFLDNGIEILGVGVGITQEQLGFDCLSEDNPIPVIEIDNYAESNLAATTLFSLISSCDAAGLVVTPFNGGYSAIDNVLYNGKRVYQHSENWIVRWENEVWVFIDPSGFRYSMAQAISIDTPWPVTSSWTWESEDGYYTEYTDVLVCCSDTPTPTRQPSNVPTVTPTFEPSVTPTDCPSTHPVSAAPTTKPITSEPTVDPTTSTPSKSPTRAPTDAPITSEPSVSPTIDPSTSPTTQPTHEPTVSQPTAYPSVVPSHSPSFNPSGSPTYTSYPISGNLVLVEQIGMTSLTSVCPTGCTPLVYLVESQSNAFMRVTGTGVWYWLNDLMWDTPYSFYIDDPILLEDTNIPLNCVVSNGAGVMPQNAVNDVLITCTPTVYYVSGTAVGAIGTVVVGLVGGDGPQNPNPEASSSAYQASASGVGVNDNFEPFAFGGPIISGLAYNVSVITPPPGQACYVVNGDGFSSVNVTNVEVHCYNTDDPTLSPSWSPSQPPVVAPSYGPSVVPTPFPSRPPTIFVSKPPSVTPTMAPSDPPCPCLSNDPLSIGMDSVYIISDESNFINDVLTICFSVPEYYDIAKMYLLKEEPDMDAAWPNPTYWSYESNNITCRATICLTYTWEQLLAAADMVLVERRDTLYYQGIVDVTIDDCYPDIDRRICWQFPFALELPRTTEVCTDAVTIVGGDPKFEQAFIVKLGQYIPQPYSVQVRVIVRTWVENPWRLAGDDAKIRPSDELIAQGLTADVVSQTLTDIENCDYDLVGAMCVQELDIVWDLNAMCQITGFYWLDTVVRASGNEDSDVPLTLQLELGLDPSCPQTLGSLPLGATLLSYEDAELTVLKQEFDIYEKAYFLLNIDSVRQIAEAEITRIQLKQDDVGSIIYYKGEAVGWGSDPVFGFEISDTAEENQKSFGFVLEPDYIEALLTGSELVVCVDAEVTYLGGTRTRMRILFETETVEDETSSNVILIEQPIYLTGNNVKTEESVAQEVAPVEEEDSSKSSPVLFVTIAFAISLLCALTLYCTYKYFQDSQTTTKTYRQVQAKKTLRSDREVRI